jgi:hypothetical protein
MVEDMVVDVLLPIVILLEVVTLVDLGAVDLVGQI